MSVCVVGSLNLDIICRVARLPQPGETVAGHGVDRLPGGKGGNQAVAAARCGAAVRFIGSVGQDEAGEIMLASLDSAGVATADVIAHPDLPTGQAFIWVSEAGENSIVVAGGANHALTPDMVLRALRLDGQVVLAQLETPVDAIEAAFAAAASSVRILNAAPAIDDGRRLFPLTDILIVNETELAHYAATAVSADHDAIAAAARSLLSSPGQTVIVTLGAVGALAVSQDLVISVEGRSARVVDTTGAGDCFCGVLAARLAAKDGIQTAMTFANAAAALSTQRLGATPSMPTLTEIQATLAEG